MNCNKKLVGYWFKTIVYFVWLLYSFSQKRYELKLYLLTLYLKVINVERMRFPTVFVPRLAPMGENLPHRHTPGLRFYFLMAIWTSKMTKIKRMIHSLPSSSECIVQCRSILKNKILNCNNSLEICVTFVKLLQLVEKFLKE